MEKKHAKHRAIPKAIISHPVYKGMKAFSKTPHRYDMWEDSVVGGLHIFEWIVILLVGVVVFGVIALTLNGSAQMPVGGGSCGAKCPTSASIR